MAVDVTAVARVVGIETTFRDLRAGSIQYLPQHIGVIAQGSSTATYPLEPYRITSALMAAQRYGFGSPIHLIALQLQPPTGSGVGSIPITVFPLEDDDDGVAAIGSIMPSGTAAVQGTYRVRIGGILSAPFTLVVGDIVATIVDKMVASINGVLEMPAVATDGTTDVGLEAKWKGEAGNDLVVEVVDSLGAVPTTGVTFAITQPATGAADPDIAPALAMLGSLWVTLVVNGLSPTNTGALDALSAVGEGRWGQLVRRPFVAFVGNTEAVVATATAITNARPTDRVNVQLVAPGSASLPFVVAAAQVREIAKVANNNPPTDYGSRPVRGISPGADGVQWDYAQRDQAVKAGCSTVELKNGLVNVSDVVTMYHPTGESPPAYRHVVDIIKLTQIIYNLDLEFANPRWDGAPLIPDSQATVNPNARKPSGAKAAVCAILDSLALEAIISEPKAAKAATVATINSQNPKRLDIQTTVQLSGSVSIISVDLFFGFYFGTPAVLAA
jgi:phage tail sheath gpL-like